MNMRALLAAVLLLLSVAPVAAQDVKIEAKPPEREPREIITPGIQQDRTRPSDRDFYPDGPRVEHDPAFIEALSGEYQTGDSRGRAGIAGWTSPNTPLGSTAASGYREVTGWAGLGFSMTWGAPPRVAPKPAPAR